MNMSTKIKSYTGVNSSRIPNGMELELRTHRWVQMSIVEFEEVQSFLSEDGNDKIINSGYSYTHPVTDDPTTLYTSYVRCSPHHHGSQNDMLSIYY